jgi:hypothetical protein
MKVKAEKLYKIGQPLILDKSLKGRADWYKPGIFYLKKRYPGGTLQATQNVNKSENKNLIINGYYKNELVECHNSYGEVLLCTENKFIPAPLEEIREEKLKILLKDNLF